MAEDELRKLVQDEYTVKEAADTADVSEVTIRRHMGKGALTYVKRAGGSVRIPRCSLAEYLGYDPEQLKKSK
jgi:excisionase family DNA binding protein